MILLENDIINFPDTETFSQVKNFGAESVTGGNLDDLIFESDYMKTLDMEGHMQVFLTT